MSGSVKKVSTKLTGLPVSLDPRKTLMSLYKRILIALQQMPKDASYRINTESIVNERLNIVSTEENVDKIEQKINCGQAEELILQAKNELELTKKMMIFKPWESLATQPPPDQWKWPI